MATIQNDHNPKWPQTKMATIQNGHNQNGHKPKWPQLKRPQTKTPNNLYSLRLAFSHYPLEPHKLLSFPLLIPIKTLIHCSFITLITHLSSYFYMQQITSTLHTLPFSHYSLEPSKLLSFPLVIPIKTLIHCSFITQIPHFP